MHVTGGLVGQGHDAREDGAGQTGATDAVLGVLDRAIREGLRFADQIAGIGICDTRYIGDGSPGASLRAEDAGWHNALLVRGFGEDGAHATAPSIEPVTLRVRRPARVGAVPRGGSRTPAGLEE